MIIETSTVELSTRNPILVTGGTGFIASHIVCQLLQRGYHVRCSVRRLEDEKYIKFLGRLPGAETNLEIVEADLRDRESWELAFSGGVEYVIHTASPYVVQSSNPDHDLLQPAVTGTKV